jgi:catechol-2,3-dioxygenase
VIHRLNHAVLWVRNAELSAKFYADLLGFQPVSEYAGNPGAVFLRAEGSTNDHDLGLFSIGDDAPRPSGRAVGLYHLAWEVDTLADLGRLAQKLSEARSLVGATNHGTTRSLYAKDPDGIEFEIVWVVPAALLTDADRPGMAPLDLEADIARFGAETPGGIGISRPAPVG